MCTKILDQLRRVRASRHLKEGPESIVPLSYFSLLVSLSGFCSCAVQWRYWSMLAVLRHGTDEEIRLILSGLSLGIPPQLIERQTALLHSALKVVGCLGSLPRSLAPTVMYLWPLVIQLRSVETAGDTLRFQDLHKSRRHLSRHQRQRPRNSSCTRRYKLQLNWQVMRRSSRCDVVLFLGNRPPPAAPQLHCHTNQAELRSPKPAQPTP